MKRESGEKPEQQPLLYWMSDGYKCHWAGSREGVSVWSIRPHPQPGDLPYLSMTQNSWARENDGRIEPGGVLSGLVLFVYARLSSDRKEARFQMMHIIFRKQ